ncbi:MAG: hypothetical protein VX840_02825, partial [Pseudomonadota bacterium]|nr:hypothetical protein [Pseudomonadota bacterium]
IEAWKCTFSHIIENRRQSSLIIYLASKAKKCTLTPFLWFSRFGVEIVSGTGYSSVSFFICTNGLCLLIFANLIAPFPLSAPLPYLLLL